METALRATRGRVDEQVQPETCQADFMARAADARAVIAMLRSCTSEGSNSLQRGGDYDEKRKQDEAPRKKLEALL